MKYAGRLLVAPPLATGKDRAHSVIYIYDETENSAVGITLTKLANRDVKHLAKHCGASYSGDDNIHIGGPLHPSALIMLHTSEWKCSNTMEVPGGFSISSDKSMIQRICDGDAPYNWRLFFGTNVWNPIQLDRERAAVPPNPKRNSWLVASAAEEVIFQTDPKMIWEMALERAIKETAKSILAVK